MEPGADDTEGFGQNVQRLAAYFYAGNGLLTSTQAARLQQDFDTLMKFFDHVGLCTNVSNTVIMDCWPCRALRGHFLEAYVLWMMGEGHAYLERLRQWVRFPKCNLDLVAGSLASHRYSQHPPTPQVSPEPIGFSSCGHHATSLAQWGGVWVGPWSGAHSGSIYSTSTCTTQQWC